MVEHILQLDFELGSTLLDSCTSESNTVKTVLVLYLYKPTIFANSLCKVRMQDLKRTNNEHVVRE